MPVEVSRIEGAITLAHEVLHRAHISVDIAKILHGNHWKEYFGTQPLEGETMLLANPNHGQSFIDDLGEFFSSTTRGGQEYRDRRHLTDIEVAVVKSRYGLDDGKVRNFPEVSEATSIARDTVYNADTRARTLLHHIPESRWIFNKYFL